MMWKQILIVIWLAVMSFWDIRRRTVPVWMLWTGAAAAAGMAFLGWFGGNFSFFDLCRALAPGAMLLIVAAATGKAGYADGVVLMILGAASGYKDSLAVLFCGLFLIALFSGFMLMLRRVKRNTKIPFVPFLTAGWMTVVIGKAWLVK